ncbi:MAG: hypothetical protein KDH96_13360 [Candidatus Riesia sp.]|nr:hypothetical protein [Candidatus Riesia sp.]
MIKKFKEYIKEGNVGMGSLYYTEYPYQYTTLENPVDRGKEGNIEFQQMENKFDEIQDHLKEIIKEKSNREMNEDQLNSILSKFFSLGNNKRSEIKQISDSCKDPKKCAKEIFDKYYKYVEINFVGNDNINDTE